MAYSEHAAEVAASDKKKPKRIRKAAEYAKLLEKRVALDGGNSADGITPKRGGHPIEQFASTWLSWQCRMISGLIHGAVFLPSKQQGLGRPITQWPKEGEDLSLLSTVAGHVIAERRSMVRANEQYDEGDGFVCDVVACPLLMDGELVAVAAIMMSPRSQPQRHSVSQLLQWGVLWIETLIRQQSNNRIASSDVTLKLLTAALGHTEKQAVIIEIVNSLADYLKCERVSIGLRKDLTFRLAAISHMARIDGRSQLVRFIEAAMEEAVDQLATVVHPIATRSTQAISRAHDELVKHQGKEAICTVPLLGRSSYIGAICCEREINRPFDEDTLKFCESVAKLIGPIIEIKMLEERSLFSRSVGVIQHYFAHLFGLGHLKSKLVASSVAAILFLFSVITGEHRITAPALLQAQISQLLVAPQNGYVKEGIIRAGHLVKKGDLLATLDDHTLVLEKQKLLSEKNQYQQEYQKALAERDRAQLSILSAQIGQVTAQIHLVDDKISRTQLSASFAGVVVSGDLSQAQGAPVALGEILFEIAPLDNYRVILEVDEHDIANIKEDQQGQLIMAALPSLPFTFSVESTASVAVSREGRNFFRVEAVLNKPSEQLRPGMQGVAKIGLGQRNLLWVWTHGLFDRLRLWGWSIGLIA
jgi:multidrug resistance efflux pump